MLVPACVRSGFCCTKAPCGFGKWNEDKSQCEHLAYDSNGLAACLEYARISADPSSSVSPAFGAGCCMSLFNEPRERIIKEFHSNSIPVVDIDM